MDHYIVGNWVTQTIVGHYDAENPDAALDKAPKEAWSLGVKAGYNPDIISSVRPVATYVHHGRGELYCYRVDDDGNILGLPYGYGFKTAENGIKPERPY